MSTVLDDLVVVLRGDAAHYQSAMGSGIRLLTDMDNAAAKTGKRLEEVSRAWAQPTSAEGFLKNEIELQEAVTAHREQIEKDALREKMARMEAESERSWQSQEEQKQAEEERLSAERNDLATFQSWRVAERQRELQEHQELEGQLFNLTHNRYDRQLRALQQSYIQQRTAHAGNARALITIDEIYFRQWRQIEQSQDIELQRNLLGRRGIARRAAMQILPALGMVTGGQVGMLAMMTTQGLGIGAAMGGMMLIAGAIKKATEESRRLKEMHEQYNEALRKSIAGWEAIAASQVPMSEWGRSLGEEIKKRRDEMEGVERGFGGKMRTRESPWYLPWVGDQEVRYGGSTGDKAKDAATRRTADLSQQIGVLETLQERALQNQLRRNEIDRRAAEEAARIQTMHEGPARQRRQLEHDIENQRRTVERANADRKIALEQSIEMARFEAEQQEAQGYHGKVAAVEERAAERRLVLEEEAQQALLSVDYIGSERRLALERQFESQRRSETQAAVQASINLHLTGWSRELALLRLKHQQERDEENRAGGINTTNQQRRQDEEALARKEHQREIDDINRSISERLALALHQVTPAQLEVIRLQERLTEKLGFTQLTAERMGQKLKEALQAEVDMPLLDQIAELNIELELTRGNITELAAEIQKLALAHRGASQEAIESLANTKHRLDLEKWAKEQWKIANPEKARRQEMKEYGERLKEAVEARLMTEQDAVKAWQEKKSSLWGGAGKETGEFRAFRPMFIDPRGMAGRKPEYFLERMDQKLSVLIQKMDQGLN